MERIDKQAILDRTNHGINIYAHILRECFPDDEVVMHISGRDCGLCRNPFANGASTLNIWVEKSNPADVLSAEFALHSATDNSIPDGDAFSFAELHYNQSGDELFETLNRELNLHIGKSSFWYRKSKVISTKESESFQLPTFSFFHAPITNTKPDSAFTLLDAYHYIVGNQAMERTEKLRSFADPKQSRMFKSANFDYCTFSGIFTSRNDKALIKHSGLLCLDFDHLQNLDLLRYRLLQDEYFDTQLLFRSPSGDGLKWVIEIEIFQTSHTDYFRAVANYLFQNYGVEVDKSGKDISRACYLPHDPNCFINLKYLNK
jgi:hypothetical protein